MRKEITKKKAITITVEENMIVEAKKLAKLEKRSLSNYIEWLILNASKKNG